MNQKKAVMLFFCIAFLLIIGVGLYYRQSLMKAHLLTSGVITDVNWGTKTGRFIADCLFEVNGKEYKTTHQITCSNIALKTLRGQLVNKHVPVIYNPKSPGINMCLIEEKDYNDFKVPIPDSMRQIITLLKCDESE